jgi:cobalt-zinc-cadmium efflux system membrane fusion protein
MSRHSWTATGVAIVLALIAAVARSSDDGHEDAAHHEPDEHRGEVFSVSDFAKLGVTTATAGPGAIDVALELPGEIRPNGDHIAHIAARFPGVVRDVRAGIGDRVSGGDPLATIESENLSAYTIRAPFDGTVIDRHLAVGEIVDQASAIFILADLSTVWLDVNVHQHGLAHVAPGRTVTLREVAGDRSAQAEISYVSPIIDQETRTATARAVVANADGGWRPGTFVVATIEEPVAAPIVIPRHALQTFEGETTVFVVEGEQFAPRRVTVGAQGRSTIAITAGLAAGDRVADEGSFLVNAELAKGEAGHDH